MSSYSIIYFVLCLWLVFNEVFFLLFLFPTIVLFLFAFFLVPFFLCFSPYSPFFIPSPTFYLLLEFKVRIRIYIMKINKQSCEKRDMKLLKHHILTDRKIKNHKSIKVKIKYENHTKYILCKLFIIQLFKFQFVLPLFLLYSGVILSRQQKSWPVEIPLNLVCNSTNKFLFLICMFHLYYKTE